MLKKTRSGADKIKVTFVLPPQGQAGHVHVVGDFNHWQASTPMKRDKDGRWRATLELEPGRDYQFRYLVDGNCWINDEAADRYVANPFGADNCVLTTPAAAAPAGSSARRSAAGNGGTRGTSTGKGAPKAKAGGAKQEKPVARGRNPRSKGE